MTNNKLYLVNYCHSNSEQMKSITELPEQEAFAIAKKLYDAGPCRAHRGSVINFL